MLCTAAGLFHVLLCFNFVFSFHSWLYLKPWKIWYIMSFMYLFWKIMTPDLELRFYPVDLGKIDCVSFDFSLLIFKTTPYQLSMTISSWFSVRLIIDLKGLTHLFINLYTKMDCLYTIQQASTHTKRKRACFNSWREETN